MTSPDSAALHDELIPTPMAPRSTAPRPSALQAQLLLERYRVLAMAMATRAIAMQWDAGLIASAADEQLTPAATGPMPFEQEVLGLIGVTRGRATAQLEEAERGVTQALQDVTTLEAQHAGLVLPLDELAQVFGLSAMSKLILVLVAAQQLWGRVHQLFRIALNDPLRTSVDEYLLQELLGPQVNPHLVARALDPDGALVRGGLVIVDDTGHGRPLRGLHADPLVLAQLRGEPLDTDPEGMLATSDAELSLSQIVMSAGACASVVRWATESGAGTPLVVRGRAGSGRTTLLASLAAVANRRLAHIELAQLGTDPATGLARALQRCRVAGWVPCVSGFDSSTAVERDARERLAGALAAYPGPLALRLAREDQVPLRPGYRLVDLQPLLESQRGAIWRAGLARHRLPLQDHARFAAKWQLAPGAIYSVIADAAQSGAPAHPSDLAAHIESAVAQHLQHRLGDVAERIHRLPRLEDMVLPVDVLDNLTEFLSRTRLGQRVYEEWGMSRVATTGGGLTALFQGAPGTGKTMVAGALAHELGLELYRVDLSRILSKWIGETERNLANVFAAAEEAHAVILFDEADSLFTKRTEVKSSNDRHANVEVNYLLQRLDSFTGIAILTTNFGTAIDPAFKRRLAFRITFPIPDEEIREQLWRKHLPSTVPLAGNLDLVAVARKFHLSGGAVRNCAVRAAFLAASEDQALSQEHLLRAIRLEYRAVGKLSEGGPLE